MSIDITDILSEWEFDPDDQYRVVAARDGRDVLQVRQPSASNSTNWTAGRMAALPSARRACSTR